MFTGVKNDPDAIKEVMEGLKDHEVFFHFRFRTKGKLDTDSCHPFKIFDEMDRQLYLMHNGTLSGFGSNDVVDSEDFGLKVAGPLYGVFARSGVRSPLHDPLYQQVLQEYVGSHSKVVLLDSSGDTYIVNQKGGDDYEDEDDGTKFWVSNTYSFDRYHREPQWKKNQQQQGQQFNTEHQYEMVSGVYYKIGSAAYNAAKAKLADAGQCETPFQKAMDEIAVDLRAAATEQGTASGSVTTPVTLLDSTPQPSTQELTVTTVKENPWTNEKSGLEPVTVFPAREARESYLFDVLKLGTVEGLFDLEYDDIRELCVEDPDAAASIIGDLLLAIYEDRYNGEFEA
jgi:hypothetical protein